MEEEIWGRKLHFFFLLVWFYNFDDNVFRTLDFFLVPEPFIKTRCLCWSMVENATDENRQDLLAELNMMKKLEPHQNVIQLLGCVTKSGLPVNLISMDQMHKAPQKYRCILQIL